jgi:hypothetical protein
LCPRPPRAPAIGESIAGGIPAGAYGLTDNLAERILADSAADLEAEPDHPGGMIQVRLCLFTMTREVNVRSQA